MPTSALVINMHVKKLEKFDENDKKKDQPSGRIGELS